jgi:HAD superfamily hydrolase (TIGR01509 family)
MSQIAFRHSWRILGFLLLAGTASAATAWVPSLAVGRSTGSRCHALKQLAAVYVRPSRIQRTPLRMASLPEDGKIQGLLFDCDGTLVNSMPMWADNWVQTCAEFGLELDEQRFFQLAGLTIEETLDRLCKEQGVEVDANKFFKRKDELAAESVKLVKEIYPVAQVARKGSGKYKMAVVSSGPRAMVQQFLRQTNLSHLFQVLVCAEDVTRHKPHPEPFLLAAKLLDLPPEACRAYEDADAGCESVRAAGMSLVDVRLLDGHPQFAASASKVGS